MTKWVLLAITLVVAWYVWKSDNVGNRPVQKAAVTTQSNSDADWCEVKRIDCKDLTRMLNSFGPGRYFDAAGKLLDTSLETMTILREDNQVVFLVAGGTKVIHNQSGREKGYVTVIFSDGYTMKYDKKGNLISAK